MSKTKQKKSPLQIIARILLVLVIIFVLFFLGVRLFFRLPVRDYYKASEKGFVIPGLKDGFIPQGLYYEESLDSFFVTGYMKDGSASPIYVVSGDGKLTATSHLLNVDGSAHDGHAGGLAVYGDYTYVAGGHDCCLYVFSTADLLQDGDAKALGTFSTGVGGADDLGVAFITIDGDKIIAGEFYREVSYPTADSHKLTTTAGDYNQALAVSYQLSNAEEATFGILPTPIEMWSLPDQAQGMVIHNGKVYISTSWGTSNSIIYSYDMSKIDNGNTISLFDETYPLLELDSASLLKETTIAPMSEEIIFKDGLMYTMCESASTKYIFGKFTSGKYCYATKME